MSWGRSFGSGHGALEELRGTSTVLLLELLEAGGRAMSWSNALGCFAKKPGSLRILAIVFAWHLANVALWFVFICVEYKAALGACF